jgi:hypothetical protein
MSTEPARATRDADADDDDDDLQDALQERQPGILWGVVRNVFHDAGVGALRGDGRGLSVGLEEIAKSRRFASLPESLSLGELASADWDRIATGLAPFKRPRVRNQKVRHSVVAPPTRGQAAVPKDIPAPDHARETERPPKGAASSAQGVVGGIFAGVSNFLGRG